MINFFGISLKSSSLIGMAVDFIGDNLTMIIVKSRYAWHKAFTLTIVHQVPWWHITSLSPDKVIESEQ